MLKLTKNWYLEQDDQNSLRWGWRGWITKMPWGIGRVGEDGEFGYGTWIFPECLWNLCVGTAHLGFHTGDVLDACPTFGVCLPLHHA